jgi:hypothetical protein
MGAVVPSNPARLLQSCCGLLSSCLTAEATAGGLPEVFARLESGGDPVSSAFSRTLLPGFFLMRFFTN